MKATISLDGQAMEMGYELLGEEGKRTLLLLHAFPFDRRMWRKVAEPLSQHYRCLTVDLPGFGESSTTAEALSIDSMAQATLALLDQLGIATCVPVGLSMGGYVTLSLFEQAPSHFSGVVLANTRARADNETERRARDVAIVSIEKNGIDAYLEGVADRIVPEAAPEIKTEVRALAGGAQASVIAGLKALRDRPDRSRLLNYITCPALVVGGALDTITPSTEMKPMKSHLPHARWVELADVGHMSAVEKPFEFRSVVEQFLSS